MHKTLAMPVLHPQRSNEHVDPHLVAGWRASVSLEPLIRPDGKRDFRRLTGLLNTPLDAIGKLGQRETVWHCILSAAPGDRLLSDAEWNAIAVEFMHRMGLARRDNPAGVRWVAVRHGLSAGGIDHIHIAVTLARQDGGLPSIHNDFLRARQACLAIEQQFGLRVTAPADRTAAVQPTRAESERTQRNGRAEPPRITVRRHVQEATAMAGSEADFFGRLRKSGCLIRERRSDRAPGMVTGYAVALPGDVSRSGEPVWYGGGKLAPDLTLPKLRRRWERSGNADRDGSLPEHDLSARSVRALLRSAACSAAEQARNESGFVERLGDAGVLVRLRYSGQRPGEVTGYALSLPGHADGHGQPIWYSGGRLSADLTLPRLRGRWRAGQGPVSLPVNPSERRAVWEDAIRVTAHGAHEVRLLIGTDQAAAADAAWATADALRMSARAVRGLPARELRRAADEFDRAARESYGRTPPRSSAGNGLRTVARLLAILGGSSDLARLTTLVANLADLADAVAELRRAQRRDHQAAAALASAERLSHLASEARAWSASTVRSATATSMPPTRVADAGFPVLPVRQRPAPSRPQAHRPGQPRTSSRRPQGPAP
jgi:hypothetical protein